MNNALSHLDFLTEKSQQFLAYNNCTSDLHIVFATQGAFNQRMVSFYEETNTILFNADYFRFHCREFALLLILDELYRFIHQDEAPVSKAFPAHFSKTWVLLPLAEITCTLEVFRFLQQQSVIADFNTYIDVLHRNALNISNSKTDQISELFVGKMCSIRQYCDTGKKIVYIPQILPGFCLVLRVDLDLNVLSHFSIPITTYWQEHWKELMHPLAIEQNDFTSKAQSMTRQFTLADPHIAERPNVIALLRQKVGQATYRQHWDGGFYGSTEKSEMPEE